MGDVVVYPHVCGFRTMVRTVRTLINPFCFKYTVNSIVVYHRRTNVHLVLRVIHAAYFLQKMPHVGLGEIYLQGALGFCESVF